MPNFHGLQVGCILIVPVVSTSWTDHELKVDDTLILTIPGSFRSCREYHISLLETFVTLPNAQKQLKALSDDDAQKFIEFGDWV